MTKNLRAVAGLVACFFLLSGAAMASEAQDLTVGDLAVSLTKLITHKTDVQTEDAVAYLQAIGVELPADLDARVSEAAMVDALQQIGVRLTTSNPDRTVSDADAGRIFRMFDRNDSLFSSELYKVCNVQGDGTGEPRPCVTDSDCEGGGKCKVVVSIKCKGGANDNVGCMSDADCPGGTCQIPPGQAKKIFFASPSD
jgi:hypothetical protein